jgi:tRNA-(ms[2]io[6]A)-hydroxylase
MIKLLYNTPQNWAEGVVAAMDDFLPDHAAAEKKASGMAMGMVSHYPDRTDPLSGPDGAGDGHD